MGDKPSNNIIYILIDIMTDNKYNRVKQYICYIYNIVLNICI